MNSTFFHALLIAVGLFVGEESQRDFTVWEAQIQAFERQDRADAPSPGGVLFVGSSSIRLWKLPRYFSELDAINRGFGGSQIIDSIHFADRIVLKYRPRTIVLYAGDNDIAAGKSAPQVFADFKRFVDVVHKELPQTNIVFIAIKPSIARWNLAERMKEANDLIADFCRKQDRLGFVDIWAPMLGADGRPRRELFVKDGLHLSHTGYQMWTELVLMHLTKE